MGRKCATVIKRRMQIRICLTSFPRAFMRIQTFCCRCFANIGIFIMFYLSLTQVLATQSNVMSDVLDFFGLFASCL